MQPWKYDYTVHPLAWRTEVEKDFTEKKVLRFGVLRTDGVVDPSPACTRAMTTVEAALVMQATSRRDQPRPTCTRRCESAPYYSMQMGARCSGLHAKGRVARSRR